MLRAFDCPVGHLALDDPRVAAQAAFGERFGEDLGDRLLMRGVEAVGGKIRLSCRVGGDSSVRERDLDAGAAEVDHRDQRVGGVESVCAV